MSLTNKKTGKKIESIADFTGEIRFAMIGRNIKPKKA